MASAISGEIVQKSNAKVRTKIQSVLSLACRLRLLGFGLAGVFFFVLNY